MSKYKEYIESDDQLNAIFGDKFSDIENLSEDQLEKAVFYLKSIHSYYEDSDNRWDLHDAFTTKLDALKNSSEQINLQNDGYKTMRKGALSRVS